MKDKYVYFWHKGISKAKAKSEFKEMVAQEYLIYSIGKINMRQFSKQLCIFPSLDGIGKVGSGK